MRWDYNEMKCARIDLCALCGSISLFYIYGNGLSEYGKADIHSWYFTAVNKLAMII